MVYPFFKLCKHTPYFFSRNADRAKSIAARAGVGGLFGGALFVAGILIVLFIWRRRRQGMHWSKMMEDLTPFNDQRSSITLIGYPQGLGMSREERGLDGVASLRSLSELSPAYASSGIQSSRIFDGSSQSQPYVQHRDRGPVVDLPPSYSDPGRLTSALERPPPMPAAKVRCDLV